MSQISTGGAGAEGLDLGKVSEPKSIDSIGKADKGDAAQFQQAMGTQQTEGTPQTQQVSGPFDMQANRITDANLVAPKPQNTESVGKAFAEKVSGFLNSGKENEQQLLDMLKSANTEDGLSPSKVIEVQYHVSVQSNSVFLVGSMVKQATQGLQSVFRNQ